MRSPSAVPPGSRTATTCGPRRECLGEEVRLGRLAAAVDSLERHEHRAEDTAVHRRTSCTRGLVVRPIHPRVPLADGDAHGVGARGGRVRRAPRPSASPSSAGRSPTRPGRGVRQGRGRAGRSRRRLRPASRSSRAEDGRARPQRRRSSGAAGAAADRLRARGYLIRRRQRAEPVEHDADVVMYRPGYRAEARAWPATRARGSSHRSTACAGARSWARTSYSSSGTSPFRTRRGSDPCHVPTRR